MKQPNKAIALVSLIAALTVPMAAHAHKTWLLPNASLIDSKDGVVVVDAGVSEDLFEFERGMELGQLSVIGPDGQPVAAEAPMKGRVRNSFEVTLAQPGTYRISNTVESMMVSYKVGSESKRWRGKPEDLAKDVPADAQVLGVSLIQSRQETFVSKTEPGKTVPPAGVTAGLTLQALGPVTDLSSGDSTRFVLLYDGKPAADVNITLLRGGNRYRYKLGEITLKTDAKGEFSVKWAEPGRYWLGASHGDARPPAPAAAAPGVAASGPMGAPPPMLGGTRDKPLRRAGYSATFDVLPK